MEAVARLVPGFMGHEESADEESFSSGLLEYPHYTRPEEYRGLRVPQVLQGGDHKAVALWRREQALELTLARRPDLLRDADLESGDADILRRARKSGVGRRLGKNLYLALLHAPVLNKFGHTVSVSLTNLDVHDIARVSRTCGLGGYYIATPLSDQRALLDRLIGHWLDGPGRSANRDRSEAFGAIRAATDLDEIIRDIEGRCGQPPIVIATSARDRSPMEIMFKSLMASVGVGSGPPRQYACPTLSGPSTTSSPAALTLLSPPRATDLTAKALMWVR